MMQFATEHFPALVLSHFCRCSFSLIQVWKTQNCQNLKAPENMKIWAIRHKHRKKPQIFTWGIVHPGYHGCLHLLLYSVVARIIYVNDHYAQFCFVLICYVNAKELQRIVWRTNALYKKFKLNIIYIFQYISFLLFIYILNSFQTAFIYYIVLSILCLWWCPIPCNPFLSGNYPHLVQDIPKL